MGWVQLWGSNRKNPVGIQWVPFYSSTHGLWKHEGYKSLILCNSNLNSNPKDTFLIHCTSVQGQNRARTGTEQGQNRARTGPEQGQNRARAGPEQGFPCVLILKGKNLFSLQGTLVRRDPVFVTGNSLRELAHREIPLIITGNGFEVE